MGKNIIIVGGNAQQLVGNLSGFATWLYGKLG
jgi:hypothetical protein